MQVSRQKNKLLRRITTLGMLLQFPQFYLVIQIIQPNEFAKKIKLNLHFRIVFTNGIHDQAWQRLLLNSSRLLLAGHSKHEKKILTYQRRWTEGSDLSKDILQFNCRSLVDAPTGWATRLEHRLNLSSFKQASRDHYKISAPQPEKPTSIKLFLIHRFIRTNHYRTCFLFSSRI